MPLSLASSSYRRRSLATAVLLAGSALSGCVMRDEDAAPPPVEQVPPPAAPQPEPAIPPAAGAEALPGENPAPVEAAPLPPRSGDPGAASDRLGIVSKIDVALLLPLSGANAGLGTDMENAALLAMDDSGGGDLALTPKDTGGTPEGAAAATREAIADGARLILGPLTATEAEAVKPIAAAAHINVVAFSNVSRIAGDGMFVMGFLPQQEIQRVIQYAHDTGIQHFAVMAGSDPYGQLAADAFGQSVTGVGGTADPPELYQPDLSDLNEVIRHLVADGSYAFTGLLLPAGGNALKQVAGQLAAAQVTPPRVRLLGTGLWDLADVGGEPTLVGGWYAAAPHDGRQRFEQRYAETYGHPPAPLATLAYDAVGMSAVLARTRGGDFSIDALTQPSGFTGADGLFRFRQDGTDERALAVLQVEQNGVSVVSPAPDSFQPVGQ